MIISESDNVQSQFLTQNDFLTRIKDIPKLLTLKQLYEFFGNKDKGTKANFLKLDRNLRVQLAFLNESTIGILYELSLDNSQTKHNIGVSSVVVDDNSKVVSMIGHFPYRLIDEIDQFRHHRGRGFGVYSQMRLMQQLSQTYKIDNSWSFKHSSELTIQRREQLKHIGINPSQNLNFIDYLEKLKQIIYQRL